MASLTIAMFVGFIALWVWCLYVLCKRIVPDVPIPTTHLLLPSHTTGVTNASNSAHNMDISWQTLLTHPEDLEQHHIASAFPHLFGPTRKRVLFLGTLCQIPMFFVPIGTLLLTYPSIAFSHATGLDAWTTSAGATDNTYNYSGWGDPIIAANWYWLVGFLSIAMVVNATANNRSNRSWCAAASVMSALCAAMFYSFFIYSCRRLNASYGNFVSMSLLNSANAQYAEIAGAGIVMLALTGLSVLFFIRYFVYLHITPEQHRAVHTPAHLDGPTEVRVDKEDVTHHDHADSPTVHVPGPAYDVNAPDQTPSYNRSVLSGVSIPLRFLLVVEAIVLFAWWVVQLVQECSSDIFTYGQADAAYFYNERMFLLCVALGATAFASAVHTERHLSRPTDLAAWATSALTLAAFFLLVWPFAYQSVYSGGDLYETVCPTGSKLCRLTQTTGVFAMIQGFLFFFIFLHTTLRVCTTWNVAPQVSAPGRMGRLSLSMLVMAFIVTLVWIWAFVTIAETIHPGLLTADAAGTAGGCRESVCRGLLRIAGIPLPHSGDSGGVVGMLVPWEDVEWQSPAWRGLTVASFVILFLITVPLMIEACRFARDLALNGAEGCVRGGVHYDGSGDIRRVGGGGGTGPGALRRSEGAGYSPGDGTSGEASPPTQACRTWRDGTLGADDDHHTRSLSGR